MLTEINLYELLLVQVQQIGCAQYLDPHLVFARHMMSSGRRFDVV